MSKTQKGLIGALIVIIGVVAAITWGIVHTAFMNRCVSTTGRCLDHASSLPLGDMIWQWLLCIFNAVACVFVSVWEALVKWVGGFF